MVMILMVVSLVSSMVMAMEHHAVDAGIEQETPGSAKSKLNKIWYSVPGQVSDFWEDVSF